MGGYRGCRSFIVSMQAETTLHAIQFTIRLVERFVAERGRWPESWEDLENLSFPEKLFGKPWPAISSEIQQRVVIDFQVDPREIARQEPMSFTAIKPIGPFFEYRDYDEVPSLQETIRKSIKGAAGP
jgi:hypothetical protein